MSGLCLVQCGLRGILLRGPVLQPMGCVFPPSVVAAASSGRFGSEGPDAALAFIGGSIVSRTANRWRDTHTKYPADSADPALPD